MQWTKCNTTVWLFLGSSLVVLSFGTKRCTVSLSRGLGQPCSTWWWLLSTYAGCVLAGDVHGLQQQLDSISERLVAGLTQLQGVSSNSMRHLEEQSATLAEAVAVRDCM